MSSKAKLCDRCAQPVPTARQLSNNDSWDSKVHTAQRICFDCALTHPWIEFGEEFNSGASFQCAARVQYHLSHILQPLITHLLEPLETRIAVGNLSQLIITTVRSATAESLASKEILELPTADWREEELSSFRESYCLQASCGKGEETVTDLSQRNTLRLNLDALQVDIDQGVLSTVLEEVQRQIVPGSAVVGAELHDILLYEKGNFFKRHRDSKKMPHHSITLSITLAASHDFDGGEIEFFESQSGREKKFKAWCHDPRSSETGGEDVEYLGGLASPGNWAAWFCSEYHSVSRVRRGWRLAATFNVLVDGVAPTSSSRAPNPPLDHMQSSRCYLRKVPFDCLGLIGSYLTLPSVLSSRSACKLLKAAVAETGLELFQQAIRHHLLRIMRLCQLCGVDDLGFVLKHQYSDDGFEGPELEELRGVDRLLHQGLSLSFNVMYPMSIEMMMERGENSKASDSDLTSSDEELSDGELTTEEIVDKYSHEGYFKKKSLSDEFDVCPSKHLARCSISKSFHPSDNIRICQDIHRATQQEATEPCWTDESWDERERKRNLNNLRLPTIEKRELDVELSDDFDPFLGTVWCNTVEELNKAYKRTLITDGCSHLWGNASTFALFYYRDAGLIVSLPFRSRTTTVVGSETLVGETGSIPPNFNPQNLLHPTHLRYVPNVDTTASYW